MKIRMRGEYVAALAGLLALLLLKGAAVNLLWYTILFGIPGLLLTFLLIDDLKPLERFLLGFPITFLFVVVVFFLSVLGVPITRLTLFLIVFVLPLLIAFFKRDKIDIDFEKLKKIKLNSDLIAALVILVVVTVAWSGLLSTTALPRTAGGAYYSWMTAVEEGITENSKILLWDSQEGLGWPLLSYESFLYFTVVPIFDLLTPWASLNAVFNQHFLMSVFLFGLGAYALMRRFGFDMIQSVLPAALLVIQSYNIRIGLLTGYGKTFFAFATFPLAILCAYMAIGKSDKRFYLPMGMMLAVAFHSHQHVGFFAAILIGFYYLLTLLVNRKIPKNILYLIGSVGIFFALTSFQLVPALATWEYTAVFEYVVPNPWFLFSAFRSDTILVGLGVLGAACLLYKREKKDVILFLVASFLIFATYFIPGIGGAYSQIVDIEKLLIVYYLVFALAMPILFSPTLFPDKRIIAAVLVVFIVLISYQAFDARGKGIEYVSEQFQTGGVSPGSIAYLQGAEDGRVISYGIFPVVDNLLPRLTGKADPGGTNRKGQHTNIYDKKIYNVWTYAPPEGTTSTYLSNLFRVSWIRHIFLMACSPGGQEAARLLNELQPKVMYSENECMHVLEVPSGAFAEKVVPADIKLGEKELYNSDGAYKVVGFSESLASDSYSYLVNSVDDIAGIPEPVALQSKRESAEEIQITGAFSSGDWVVIKEEYFPRWHAYMDGVEIPIRMSNFGLMMVQANDGNSIELRVEPFWYEYILLLIASIGLLLPLLLSKD